MLTHDHIAAEDLGKWAELVTSNLHLIPKGSKSVTVDDWANGAPARVELHFDTEAHRNPRSEAEAAFAKARRLRRGSGVIRTLITETDAVDVELQGWQQQLDGLVHGQIAELSELTGMLTVHGP